MAFWEIARQFALEKHGAQIYRGFGVVPDEPYINHLDRVAAHFPFVEQLRSVAYMHDILEDTDCSIQELYGVGFAKSEIDAIQLVTKPKGKFSIDEYYEAIRGNAIARSVKLADLSDNLSRSVKENLSDKSIAYAGWIEYLTTELLDV